MKKVINSNKPKNQNDNEEIIKKKSNITEKLTKYMIMKLRNLLEEKQYPINYLTVIIKKFIDAMENTKINEYEFIVGKLERYLIDQISGYSYTNGPITKIVNDDNSSEKIKNQGKSSYSSIGKNCDKENNQIGNLDNNEEMKSLRMSLQNINNHQRSHSTNKDMPIMFQNEKISILKEKENDEWALIAKFNYLKHVEDVKINKTKREEQQKKFKEMLQMQMQEKDYIKKLKQEEDWKFFLKQNDQLLNLQEEEYKKNKEKQEKLKNEKEYQDRIIVDIRNKRTENKIKEQHYEKMALQKIVDDIETEKDKINKKKVEEREMYLNLIKENEKRMELKKSLKFNELKENRKSLNAYSELLNKQDKDREKSHFKVSVSNNQIEKQISDAKLREIQIKALEENRYQKEKNEIDNKIKLMDDFNRLKKQKQIDEMKKILKEQIEEKQKHQKYKKENDDKFFEVVVENVKKFHEDKENILKRSFDKKNHYKNELNKQLFDKRSNLKKTMDDHEKELNTKLLQKIHDEIENLSN